MADFSIVPAGTSCLRGELTKHYRLIGVSNPQFKADGILDGKAISVSMDDAKVTIQLGTYSICIYMSSESVGVLCPYIGVNEPDSRFIHALINAVLI